MAGKGGKRPGAGRKPSTIRGIAKKLPKESAALLLAEINAHAKWISLANSTDERIQLETLKYLTDRAYGKARQSIEASAVVAARPLRGMKEIRDALYGKSVVGKAED